ncbi:hypothetical protein ACWU4D_03790 [Vibrio sp. WJH972]
MIVLKWLSLFVALGAGFFASQLLDFTTVNNVDIEYCYLSSQVCEQDNVQIKLERDITRPLQANKMTIVWPFDQEKPLTLTLRGLEMDMGIVKVPITPVGNNTYQADVVLPICTQNQMTWIGELTDGSLTIHPAIRSINE